MARDTTIMVVSDVVSDAELVSELLQDDFENILLSTDPDNTVIDFERARPAVFILAFNSIEKAERCYLGLYRASSRIHSTPHRTLILCKKSDLKTTFDLCKKRHFDNYLLFWPPPNDPFRLRFIVHRLLLEVTGDTASIAGEFASQARRLSGLEGVIEGQAAKGEQLIGNTRQSVRSAESKALRSLDDVNSTLSRHEVDELLGPENALVVKKQLERLKIEGIQQPFESIEESMKPIKEWSQALKQELEPHLETTRSLEKIAKNIHPNVLVVDDDRFQHKLVRQILADQEIDLVFATSGSEALGALRRQKPDLILMDINLPGENGIQVTRRLKSSSLFSEIPVIMVTGHGEKSTVVESMQAGAVDFIVKPFNKATMIKKIRHYCNLPA